LIKNIPIIKTAGITLNLPEKINLLKADFKDLFIVMKSKFLIVAA